MQQHRPLGRSGRRGGHTLGELLSEACDGRGNRLMRMRPVDIPAWPKGRYQQIAHRGHTEARNHLQYSGFRRRYGPGAQASQLRDAESGPLE